MHHMYICIHHMYVGYVFIIIYNKISFLIDTHQCYTSTPLPTR